MGQVPFSAGLPFFSLTFFGSFISLFFLHFTQYAVVISIHQFLGENEILHPYSLNYNYAIKGYIILIFDAIQKKHPSTKGPIDSIKAILEKKQKR